MNRGAALPPGALARGLRVQLRVIGALLMREVITRFGRYNLGGLWLLVEPMLFTLGVMALWLAAGLPQGNGLSVAAFALTGYSSVLMWRNSVGRCCTALQQNLNLMYHRPVQALDVLATRIVLECGAATASFLVLAALLTVLEVIQLPKDLLTVLLGWLLLVWFSAALALNVGALTAWHRMVERLWHPVSYLLFPLSGAAFMVDWLPPAGREFVLWLPMVHGLEIVREGYFGPAVQTHHDAGYAAGACLLLSFTGLFLTREAARRVEPE